MNGKTLISSVILFYVDNVLQYFIDHAPDSISRPVIRRNEVLALDDGFLTPAKTLCRWDQIFRERSIKWYSNTSQTTLSMKPNH